MGVIQNAVNQALGTVGVVARLSPGYERKQELYQLNKEQKIVSRQGAEAKLEGKDATDPSLMNNLGEISEREMEIAKRKFQLAPTEENFKSAVEKEKSYRAFNNFVSTVQDVQDRKREQAMQDVGAKQETRKQQKRNFMEYLGKLETSMGMNVGDLPPHMQKQIAKQYTKSERKKLMDEEDKKR